MSAAVALAAGEGAVDFVEKRFEGAGRGWSRRGNHATKRRWVKTFSGLSWWSGFENRRHGELHTDHVRCENHRHVGGLVVADAVLPGERAAHFNHAFHEPVADQFDLLQLAGHAGIEEEVRMQIAIALGGRHSPRGCPPHRPRQTKLEHLGERRASESPHPARRNRG